MITVWNTPIAASVEQILRDLKLMLFAEGLLRDQNNTGSDVMVTCPFHKGGHERKPSCGVSLKEKITPDKTYEAGTVHCYTCGYTADLPTFISDLLGMRKRLNVLLALVTGKAIVIAQSPEEKVADVLVGKNVSKKYAVSSLYSTLKAMAL